MHVLVQFIWCPFTPYLLLASLGFLAAVLIYFYSPYWGLRAVPGPPTIPLLGHLPLLTKYGPDVFSVLAKKYGPVYRFHMGRQPVVIVADPELCREVGIKKFKDVSNRSIPSPISSSPLHLKGLFFTRDSRWAAMRSAITALYQPSHLSNLLPSIQSCVESATQNLISTAAAPDSADEEGGGGSVTFSNLSLRLATDVIGRAAFGVDFRLSNPTSTSDGDYPSGGDSEEQVSSFIKEHIHSTSSLKMDLSGSFSMVLGLVFPVLQEPARRILRLFPWTADHKIDRSNWNLSYRLSKIVAGRMEDRGRETRRDFLSAILSRRDAEGASPEIFTAEYISALTYEHLLAGSATTSFTLSSVIYLVAGHPEVEKKLLKEIDGFGPPHLRPTADDLSSKFPYLDQVIKESMRFYTVSPLIARETSRAVQIGGYLLPKGTWVWLAPGVLAKDPMNFPEPHLFKPERFNPTCREEMQRHPYAHIPFGIGPRACIGQKFALQEIKLALIHLYKHCIFRHSPKMESPLGLDYGIILNFKHGVKLLVIRRDNH